MLIRSGTILIKYWFSVSNREQERRFQARIASPLKHWKLSDMDLISREKWVEYSKAKDEMFRYTDTKESPWFVVNADIKKHARLNCISHFLNQISYEDITPAPVDLPPMVKDPDYIRPPIDSMNWVPSIFGKNPEDVDRA